MQYLVRNILTLIFTVFLLSGTLSGYSRTYTFRGLSVTDGLSDLVVNALYKDTKGFVWIGTGNSLERFDGTRLKHFLIPGSNEKLKRVNAIAETQQHQIWMGNGMGLWRVNQEKETLELIAAETIRYVVHSIFTDKKGKLYVGSEGGLFIYQNGKAEQLLADPNILSAANIINGMVMDDKGQLWMATGAGLYSMTLFNKKVKSYPTGRMATTSFNNIARIGSKFYLGTMGQGIISFNDATGQFNHYVNVGCNVISSLSSDGKDLLYVGTDGNGVHFISTRQNRIIRSFRHEAGKEESLRSNSVYSVLVDREGLLWVGFYQLGLDYSLYQSGLFSTYSYPPFFDSKDMPVRTISINSSERLIGSRDGLFYIDEKTHRFKSFKTPELRSGMIMCSLYQYGKYYIGTYDGGMYIFDPSTLSIRDFEPGEPQPFEKGQIFCIKADNENNIWIGTSIGLYCYKGNRQLYHYTSANSKLPEGNVYEIYFDSTRKGWICTENGMCIWDPSSQSLKTNVFPENFIHKEKIRAVFEDSGHHLYFIPDKGNMCISDLSISRFKRIRHGTLLEGKDGMFITEDRDGWLWIGTANGLYRYDKKETFIPYNFIDGIPSSIFTFCPPVIDRNNILWMGNSKGLIYVDLNKSNKKKQTEYPLAITDIYINGKPYENLLLTKSGNYDISLKSSEDNLTVCFSGFSYTDPSYMSYEYKLEGEDKDWQVFTGKSEITYYDLSYGNYLFKLRRIGDLSSEIRMSIRIAYPILRWSIMAIITLALLGGYYFFYRSKKTKQGRVMTNVSEPEEAHDGDKFEKTTEEKYKTIKINAEECKRLSEKLEQLMRREKPYINPDLKIADLANLLDTSSHSLSYLFNQYLNKNYYDYINDYRITEFRHLVNKDEYFKYTLSALAELCGFSSRASFFRYFKKATGITPNEYVHSIGKTNE